MLGSRRGVLLVLCICLLASLVMSPCPPGCCCPRPGSLVLCESLGLRSLPRSVPLTTSALSVARNKLCNVDHLLQPFSGLQELSLSQNLLSHVPRGLPPSLESLLLQENRITYITSGALRNLLNLTRLDLEHNRIRAIQPGGLLGLHKLQVLMLKGNELKSLPLNLPPSLTHLDLSANCISVLDLPSLSALINLQVLKINSNCLRSVPENAFDALPRLRSVVLNNNLWVCECEILYLYRWLLSGRLRMATDLVCKEPVHLAQRLLLNLSVMVICPRVLKPEERMQKLGPDFSLAERKLEMLTATPTEPTFLHKISEEIQENPAEGSTTRVLPDHFSLGRLTYEQCLSVNQTQSMSPPLSKATTSPSNMVQKCTDNTTACLIYINVTVAEEKAPFLPTNRDAPWPTPHPQMLTQQLDSAVVIALLALLCVLVALLMLAVLLVLRHMILQHRRVAPLDVGSSG